MFIRNSLRKLGHQYRVVSHRRLASSKVDLRPSKYSTYDTTDPKLQMYNESSPVWSCNEWDPLEEVIVGRPDNAMIPVAKPEVKAVLYPEKWEFLEKNGGKYWADVVPDHWKKLVQEVDEFVRVLQGEGVKVVRPDEYDFGKEFKTPFFTSVGLYNAMPRDIIMVVADEILEASMTWRNRYFEFYTYRNVVQNYYKQGAKWTAAPKPLCDSILFDESFDTPNQRAWPAGELPYVTSESEPCWDAADFIRAGFDIFAQRSHVTNKSGIEWVRRHLAPRGFRVHELNFHDPRSMHIDCSLQLVKPGVALLNPDTPMKQEEVFKKAGWTLVPMTRPSIPKTQPMFMSSEWIVLNTLIRDPEHVFVEKQDEGVIKMYQKLGMKPIPITSYHMNAIGGGFHCWTSDIRRRGKLQCYF